MKNIYETLRTYFIWTSEHIVKGTHHMIYQRLWWIDATPKGSVRWDTRGPGHFDQRVHHWHELVSTFKSTSVLVLPVSCSLGLKSGDTKSALLKRDWIEYYLPIDSVSKHSKDSWKMEYVLMVYSNVDHALFQRFRNALQWERPLHRIVYCRKLSS